MTPTSCLARELPSWLNHPLSNKPVFPPRTMAKKSVLPAQTSTLNKYFSNPGPSSATKSPSSSVGPTRSSSSKSSRPSRSKRPRLSLEKEGDGKSAEQPVCLVDSSDEDDDGEASRVGKGKAREDRVRQDKGKGKAKEDAIVIDLDEDDDEEVGGGVGKGKGKGKGNGRQEEDEDELGEFMAGIEVLNSLDNSESSVRANRTTQYIVVDGDVEHLAFLPPVSPPPFFLRRVGSSICLAPIFHCPFSLYNYLSSNSIPDCYASTPSTFPPILFLLSPSIWFPFRINLSKSIGKCCLKFSRLRRLRRWR